jgi:hypothetical protein
MPAIFVNALPQTLDAAPETWGDLLDRLDAEAAREGVVLSAARFDGVEEPSFRAPDAIGRVLSDVARIEIETVAPDALLRQVLREATPPMAEAARGALELGAVYRGLDVSGGHASLMALGANLREMATLLGQLDGRRGIDIAEATPEKTTAGQHLQMLDALLHSLIAAQESLDWLTVADILEYDLEPMITRWADLLTALAQDPQ